jgi:DNA-binding winged helix-turn-helix (wHTH) protein/tetratricopeptide (TPR) repeat protein
MQHRPIPICEFGPFRLDGAERTLLREGVPVALTDKVFDLLALLVQNRGHALTKTELMQRLWPDTVVEENNLTVNISTLRKALGETAGERRYIETLSRRGYRFVAELREPESASAEPALRHLPTFVGRETELGRLAELLERARAGHGRVVFISGDPGLGKTELAEQFLARARSEGRAFVAQGRCLEQFGTGEAYLPFLEVCRELLVGPDRERVVPIVRQHAPSWFVQFGGLSERGDTLEALRQEVRDASSARRLREMGDALEALSRLSPVVLLLEDMHWADPSSADLLRLLGQRAASRRILILATVRGSEIELDNHPMKNVRRELLAHEQSDELALPLLDQVAIGDYIDARFQPHELKTDLCELIARTTEGHPLFATRLLSMLVEQGDLQQIEGRWHAPRPIAELELRVPNGVRGLIQKKLDMLAAEDRRALSHASVIGVEFTTSALASLLERDELDVDDRLDALARVHHLLEPLGEERLPNGQLSLRYRFSHVLYQNVLYEALAGRRRVLLHQKAAEHSSATFGEDDWRVAAQLALHFEAAGHYGRAIHYLKLAADNAARLRAIREAELHYARALRLLEQLPPSDQIAENIILHYNHGWCATNVNDPERGVRDFETMLRAARSPDFAGSSPEAARARDVVFDYLEEPWRDAFGLFDTPRMPNQDRSMGPSAIQCEAYWALSYVLIRQRRLDEADARTREYLALAEQSGNAPRQVEALAYLAWLKLERGDVDAALKCVHAGLPAARAIPHPRAVYMFFGTGSRAHQLRGDYELAEAMNVEALPLGMEVTGRVDSLFGIGLARAHRGRVSAAFGTLAEALDMARRAELKDMVVKIAGALGWLHGEIDDWESAARHFAGAAELASSAATGTEMLFRLELARAHLARGDVASQGEVDDPERLPPHEGPPSHGEQSFRAPRRQMHLEAARAEYQLERGDAAAAKRSAEALLEAARELGSPKYVELAHLQLARVALACGDAKTALEQASAGIDVLSERPMPLIGWKLYDVLAAAHRRAGDPASETAAAARALELVRQIEDGLDDPVLRTIWSRSRAVREREREANSRMRARAVV